MPLHADQLRKPSSAVPVPARAASAAGSAVSPAVQRLQAISRALNARPEVVAQRALSQKLSAPSVGGRRATASRAGLPDALKAGVEALSGYSMDDVRVHRNSSDPAQLQAHAFARGTDIHLAPGQERHLPHEAWHVVQQKQGRVGQTMQVKDVAINDDAALEREATRMGARAAAQSREAAPQADPARAGRPGSAVAQRAIKIRPNSWYTDPQDIAAALPRVLAPSLIAKLQSLGRDGLTHSFADWAEAIEYAAALPDPEPLSLEEMESMGDLLGRLNVDVQRYMAPTGIKGFDKVKGHVAQFNEILSDLARTPLWKQPFSVTIAVGDLKGLGDITAGAKLAVALKSFFHTIREWRDVHVRLYLDKAANLREKIDKKLTKKSLEELDKEGELKDFLETIRTARGVLAGSGVELQDVDTPVELDEQTRSVSFAYPATNVAGVDFTVSQYGYDQFARNQDQYGSGPGFGTLGVVPLTPEQVRLARERASTLEGVPGTISRLKAEYSLASMHFGYFSIYEDRPKQFAQNVVDTSAANRIGIVLARPAGKLSAIVGSLAGRGWDVQTVFVAKNGAVKKGDLAQAGGPKSKKTSKESSQVPAKLVCLVVLPDRVEHRDMLGLYYGSDAPVGATGDQSFVEAYTLRGRRNQEGYTKPTDDPDIWYDVSEQQRPLFAQMQELEEGQYRWGKQGQEGLKKVDVKPQLLALMKEKNLLFSIVMLINSTLQQER